MIKKSDLKLRLGLIAGLLIFSLFYIFPLNKSINLGLDLQGGMSVLLKADLSSLANDKKPEAINAAVEKIRNRIDAYGVKETSVQIQGLDSILVQVPGIVNHEMVDRLKEVGKLEFKLVEDDVEKNNLALKGEIPAGYELKDYDRSKLLVQEKAAIVGSDLSESFVGFDSYGSAEVRLKFSAEGTKVFAEVTEKNVGKRLAILLDGAVKSAPVIREPILSGEAQISGDFAIEEARMIVSVLNSGALPVPLSVEEERSVGPLLGSDSIKRGINSTIFGAALVVVFMVVYYFIGGIVTVICLFFNLLFILATLHLFRGTLTLPGIAGMILTLGMAVDANVLIYERIREELKLNKPLSLAVKTGFNMAKGTILDSNLTTLIAAFFLFYYGTGPIRGFATTLSLGLAISLFTSIFVGRTIFQLLLDGGLKKLRMLSVIGSSKIDFIKPSGILSAISLILVSAGMFYFYANQSKVYDIDFEGGQVLEYKITPPAEIETVRQSLKSAGFAELVIQEFKDIPGGIIIQSKKDMSADIEKSLKSSFGKVEELRVTTVGPTVGKILRKKAYLAIALSMLGILVYVAFRFKHFDYALAAVIALFHDVLITLGFLCFAGYKVNLLAITALLTIAGYSINDTIVIYDRIREIGPRMRKSSFRDVVNTALNGTLSRTIITSFATLLVVIAIYVLGGEALRGFSFALMVGMIAGTYSTVYIATYLVLLFRKS